MGFFIFSGFGCLLPESRRSACVVAVMVNGDGLSTLTRKHGIKICPGFLCSVEDISLAVGEQVGHGSIKSAARMNGGTVIFLDQLGKVNQIIEAGLTVNEMFVQVIPLAQPATKVVISNVPPFITDEFLSRELSRHGKIVSPVKKIMSGFKSKLQQHVVSHRRQLYMILNKRNEELNLRFIVKVDDYDYVIFATSSGMKCFACGEEGHAVRACPRQGDPNPTGLGGTDGAGEGPSVPPPGVPGRRGAAAWRSAPVAGSPPAAGVPAAEPGPASERPLVQREERPLAAPRAAPRGAAAVSDRAHRVSNVNTQGMSVNAVRECESEDGVLGEIEKSVVVGGKEKEVRGNVGWEQEKEAEHSEGRKEGKTSGVQEEQEKAEEKGEEQTEGGNAGEKGKEQTEGGNAGEIGKELAEGGSEKEVNEEVSVRWSEQVEEEGMEEEAEAVKMKLKRKKKAKNTANEAKTSKANEEDKQTYRRATVEESDSEDYASDGSELTGLTSSQKKAQYTVESIVKFLKETKNQHGVKVEDFFPDLVLFCSSARLHISQKEVSGLTNLEIFRLKKHVSKVKKQIRNDYECSNGVFN